MKEILDRHRARLTDAEDRRVWGAIRDGLDQPRRRWSLFRLPTAGVAVAATAVALIVVVNRLGEPPGPERITAAPEEAIESARPEAPAGSAEEPARDVAREEASREPKADATGKGASDIRPAAPGLADDTRQDMPGRGTDATGDAVPAPSPTAWFSLEGSTVPSAPQEVSPPPGTDAYRLIVGYLDRGVLPPPDAVDVDAFVNARPRSMIEKTGASLQASRVISRNADEVSDLDAGGRRLLSAEKALPEAEAAGESVDEGSASQAVTAPTLTPLRLDAAPSPFTVGTVLLRCEAGRIPLPSSGSTATLEVAVDARAVRRYRLLGGGFQDPVGRRVATVALPVSGTEAGPTVVLFELEPRSPGDEGSLATVRILIDHDGSGTRTPVERVLQAADVGPRFAVMPADFRLDAVAAELAAILRAAPPPAEERLTSLLELAREIEPTAPDRDDARALVGLIESVRRIRSGEAPDPVGGEAPAPAGGGAPDPGGGTRPRER